MRIHKTFALTLLAGLVSLAATAQTADELIAKSIDARGGKDKLTAVKTLRMSAV